MKNDKVHLSSPIPPERIRGVFYKCSQKRTTRICHLYGYIEEQALSTDRKMWKCPNCHFHHMRDEDVAIISLTRVLRDLVYEKIVPCSGLSSIQRRWAWCAWPSGVVNTLRGLCSNEVATPRNQKGDVIVSYQNHRSSLFTFGQLCIDFGGRVFNV
jgi:hypothetical protein